MEIIKCDKYFQRVYNHIHSMNSIFMNKKQLAILEMLIKDYKQCMEEHSK